MRVQVNLSEEMLQKVDSYSKKMGVSRSALCSVFIGQGIMNYDRAMELLGAIGERVGDELLSEKTMEEIKEKGGSILT